MIKPRVNRKASWRTQKIGTTFDRKWRNRLYRMRVVAQNGKAAFEVENRVFATPSAAAKSITKQEVNGWRFWRID